MISHGLKVEAIGMIQSRDGFCVCPSHVNGLRAYVLVLRACVAHGPKFAQLAAEVRMILGL